MRYSNLYHIYSDYSEHLSHQKKREIIGRALDEYFEYRDFNIYRNWLRGADNYSAFMKALFIEMSKTDLEIPLSHRDDFLDRFYEFLSEYKFVKAGNRGKDVDIDLDFNRLRNIDDFFTKLSNAKNSDLDKINMIRFKLIELKKIFDSPVEEPTNTQDSKATLSASPILINIDKAKKRDLLNLVHSYDRLESETKEIVLRNLMKRFPMEIRKNRFESKQLYVDLFWLYYGTDIKKIAFKIEDGSILSFFSSIMNEISEKNIRLSELNFKNIEELIDTVVKHYRRNLAFNHNVDLILEGIREEIVYRLFKHTKYTVPFQELVIKYVKKICGYFDKIQSNEVQISKLQEIKKNVDYFTALPETKISSLPRVSIENGKYVFKDKGDIYLKHSVDLTDLIKPRRVHSLLESYLYLYVLVTNPSNGFVSENPAQDGSTYYPNFNSDTYNVRMLKDSEYIKKFIDYGRILRFDKEIINVFYSELSANIKSYITVGFDSPIQVLISAMVNTNRGMFKKEVESIHRFISSIHEEGASSYRFLHSLRFPTIPLISFLSKEIKTILKLYDFSDENQVFRFFKDYPIFINDIKEVFRTEMKFASRDSSIESGVMFIYRNHIKQFVVIGDAIVDKLEKEQPETIGAIADIFDSSGFSSGSGRGFLIKPIIEYYINLSTKKTH